MFWFDNPRSGGIIEPTSPRCQGGVIRHADGSRSSSEQTFAGGGRAHAYFLLGREPEGGFPVRTDAQLGGDTPFAPGNRNQPGGRRNTFRQTAEPIAARVGGVQF